MGERLCKDCKHFKIGLISWLFGWYDEGRCVLFNTPLMTFDDPVSGKSYRYGGKPDRAMFVRQDLKRCGPEGSRWESC